MHHRYSLRFETGERRGERIPIPESGLSIGRRPGNSLQILDPSVSGQHAELVVDGEGVRVEDLGSTNGTRVGDQRVKEQRLAHADVVVFGSVRLVFEDAEQEGAVAGGIELEELSVPAVRATASVAAAPAAGAALAETRLRPEDGLERVSADVVARSKKVSPLGLFVLAALIAGGAAAWWWLDAQSAREGASVARAVEPVPGNLLAASYSFEALEDGWEAEVGASAAFQRASEARSSGELGLQADLAAGEFAIHRSPAVPAPAGRALRVTAALSAEGAEAALGIEFRSSSTEPTRPGPVTAWKLGTAGDAALVECRANVPPGYDQARAVVRAFSVGTAGSVAVDDVVLLEEEPDPSRTLPAGEFQAMLLGAPVDQALLAKGGRALVTALRFSDEEPAQEAFSIDAPFTAAADAGRLTLAVPAGAPPQVFLRLRAEPALVRAGIASIGEGGFRTHGLEFEREGVTSLLLGGGRELVRFVFATPVALRGREEGAASSITARSSPETFGEVVLQLDFKEERTRAGDIAHAARGAEKKGELGPALAAWSELLDRYPFEEALVTEAEAARGRLIEQGLSELRAVRGEIERARFFRLLDLYRRGRDQALAVGARYAGSEVEAQSKALAAEVEVDLAGLEAELLRDERERLSAILAVLEAEEATGLAALVRTHLETEFGAQR